MDAVASSDHEALRAAMAETKEGSPAAVYLAHLANVYEADLDGGSEYDPAEVTHQGTGSYTSCSNGGDCIEYGDFLTDSDGRLTSFGIDGQSINDRIAHGNGDVVKAAGANFTLLTSYKSIQANALYVAVKVETGNQPLDMYLCSATYRNPSGKQREATTAGGPSELAADSNALVYAAFKSVEPGGAVELEGCTNGCDDSYSVKIKVG